MSAIVWAIVLVVTVVVEVCTMQLVSIWFAVASLVTLVCSTFVDSTLVQLAIFVGVSLVLLVFTRPILKRLVVQSRQSTNYDLDVGKVATVIETVDASTQTGRVSLNGVDWNAKSVDGSVIESGSRVVVQKVEGSKLLVTSVPKE
jgi:membrane protein implicated in regulation of membrane protease activity